ncbi:TIGR03086 family metal-binding protein [Nakamurella sp. A5-74]|uniref:TIGR03086 family metal-binding protein n=1 Tax=Nakamurella sp. A5-74 TaxID=3158264 RepID=A0AAU8DL87_9ACTN
MTDTTAPDTTTSDTTTSDDTVITDGRLYYAAAQDWVVELIGSIQNSADWERPTPCSEFSVRQLVQHLLATLDRARVIAEGGDPNPMPRIVELPDDALLQGFSSRLPGVRAAWSDAAMQSSVTVPPGVQVPGHVAIWKYANEVVVHGWDLACALGLDAEAPNGIAAPVLEHAAEAIPAEVRGGFVPFESVVAPTPGAGPTEQLANWNGRDAAAWVRH